MKTWISDNFPMGLIECQFYNICSVYDPDRCGYSDKCPGRLTLEGGKMLSVRDILRKSLDDFVATETLRYEIELIVKENGKKQK